MNNNEIGWTKGPDNNEIDMEVKNDDSPIEKQQTASNLREITPEDVIKEGDRNYEIGRIHGRGEMSVLLDWAESLLCHSLPMSHSTLEEWESAVAQWRDEKNGVDTPKTKQPSGKSSTIPKNKLGYFAAHTDGEKLSDTAHLNIVNGPLTAMQPKLDKELKQATEFVDPPGIQNIPIPEFDPAMRKFPQESKLERPVFPSNALVTENICGVIKDDYKEQIESVRKVGPHFISEIEDLLSYAWSIICNAGEGDWSKESLEWQKAAKTFRSDYHTFLDAHNPKQ